MKVRPQAIQNWIARGEIPTAKCVEIERITRGDITREELRPDIFGPLF